jgi:hypothetical protein
MLAEPLEALARNHIIPGRNHVIFAGNDMPVSGQN